jgi:hypothetical protein
MALSFRTLLLVFLASCDLTLAHVALTYPPARKYDLDFLDNSRTKGPCGMPKGECEQCAGPLYTELWRSNMDLCSRKYNRPLQKDIPLHGGQNIFIESDRCSVDCESHRHLWKITGHCRIHKGTSSGSVRRQLNLICTLTTCFFKISFNNIPQLLLVHSSVDIQNM